MPQDGLDGRFSRWRERRLQLGAKFDCGAIFDKDIRDTGCIYPWHSVQAPWVSNEVRILKVVAGSDDLDFHFNIRSEVHNLQSSPSDGK